MNTGSDAMKLEELAGLKTVLFDIVPLANEEAGIAYLNDTHLWVINLNQNHPGFDPKLVKLTQIIELLESHAHCFRNQDDVFEQERTALLAHLKTLDPDTPVDLPLH